MNWKSFAEAAKAKKYVLPGGWDSLAKIAEDMGCSEEAARREWSPFVKSGEIEMQVFPVWDKLLKRVVRVTAYRKAGEHREADSTTGRKRVLKRDASGHFASR